MDAERSDAAPDTDHPAPLQAVDRDGAASEDRPDDVHERCVHHPSRAAVARCGRCGEPVCLSCAVPVRGRVLGTECLAEELGDPALTVPADPPSPGGAWRWTLGGGVAALIATAGPWTATGAGHRVFGAWVASARWSMLAALASVALVATAWWLRTRLSPRGSVLVGLLASVVVAASALAIAFPPTFQRASWAPWLALIGGALAVVGAIGAALAGRRPVESV